MLIQRLQIFHRLHYYFKNIGEENNYVMVAGEDRVTQVKRDNKSRRLQLPIREAGQKGLVLLSLVIYAL